MLDLLNEVKAAEALCLKPETLCRWRWEGKGPAYHKIGAAIRYGRADLEAFVATHRVAHND